MDNILGIVLGFALTTVAGSWWASRLQQRAWIQQNELQQRTWTRQNDVRLREEESKRAGDVCRELSCLFDRRLYRMQRLAWAATTDVRGSIHNSALEERRQEYVDVLLAWNESLNMNLALVGSYFGDDARAYLDGLYEDFKRVGQQVEHLVRAAQAGENTSQEGNEVAAQFEGRELNSLNDRVYQFCLLLMGRLREGSVGRYAPNKTTPRTLSSI